MDFSFRQSLIDDVFACSRERNAFELIERKYLETERDILARELIQIGIMPEVFDHDSSEEKLWSKLSDVILSRSLNILGLQSSVLRTRGNSADVYSRGSGYTLVSDAKCFRLSRTAKNQKDFKIKALDDWRREDTYALLVSPLSQYPADKSQIYPQAFSQNVTLLSYVHLQFLVERGAKRDLEELWQLPVYIAKNYKVEDQKRGRTYWHAIDDRVCHITETEPADLQAYKQQELQTTKDVGEEGIRYWQSKIEGFASLSKEEAVALLVKSQKIEQKIDTIRKAIEKTYNDSL